MGLHHLSFGTLQAGTSESPFNICFLWAAAEQTTAVVLATACLAE